MSKIIEKLKSAVNNPDILKQCANFKVIVTLKNSNNEHIPIREFKLFQLLEIFGLEDLIYFLELSYEHGTVLTESAKEMFIAKDKILLYKKQKQSLMN